MEVVLGSQFRTEPVDDELLLFPFQHLPEDAVFLRQCSEKKWTDELVLDVGVVRTHVAYVLDHGSDDGDGVGSLFYTRRSYGLEALNFGAKRRRRMCVYLCTPSRSR